MHAFWALTRLSIQRQMTYRAALFAGMATNLFFGVLRASVMVALYAGRPEMAGITLQEAITFTGLSQATIAFLALFSWFEIVNSVYSGQIGAELLKPMGYFRLWMAQDLGRATVNLLLRGLLIMAAYALVFDISTPERPAQWLALAVTIVLAWLVSFAWRFLVNLIAFWTPNAVGACRFFFAISWVMSGFLMPLRFYPDWFARLCYLTPFPWTVNAITDVYLGLLDGPALLYSLALQAAWIVVLILAGQLILMAGVRRLVVQGG